MALRAEGRITGNDFGIAADGGLSNGQGEILGINAIDVALDIEAALDSDLEAIGAIED
jgi:hypothetical protein